MKPGEHGPDELYEKFHVYKPRDGRTICPVAIEDRRGGAPTYPSYPDVDRLGADGEFVFVLRPESNDKAAQAALAEYARCCEGSYPGLAAGIVRELTRIDARVKAIMQMGECSEDEAYRVMAKFRAIEPDGS